MFHLLLFLTQNLSNECQQTVIIILALNSMHK
jgi:hypothetical protein